MKGKVYLVGAGPGDYKLMTLKGIEVLGESDVIIYDRLVNPSILSEIKENCELIYVGKESSNHTMKQEDINQLMVDKAREGKTITRLKGGDPYVFGRGGEEGEYLYDNGIEFEVVPGITSAIGGLCYAGIPITHRDLASSFHVITGHLKDHGEELNWKAIATLRGTLVFLMGMSNLQNIIKNLIDNGKAKETPIAIINWGTTPYQRVVTGSLGTIQGILKGITSPSLIVVGDVVKLRNKLNFFEKKSLFGKNIVVTRSRAQSSRLVEMINDLGGNPIEFPTIKISKISPNRELEKSIENIHQYNYIVFTSINGVNIFFETLFGMGYDSRRISNSRVVAIGSSTSKALVEWGIKPDIIPKEYVGESIYEELRRYVKKKDRVLIPRSKEARAYLVESLRLLCEVNEVHSYETLLGDGAKDQIIKHLDNGNIDYITFTSSSTVRNFVKIIGQENLDKLRGSKIASIGPITSKTIESFGLKVNNEAEEYTIDGLVDSIIKEQNKKPS